MENFILIPMMNYYEYWKENIAGQSAHEHSLKKLGEYLANTHTLVKEKYKKEQYYITRVEDMYTYMVTVDGGRNRDIYTRDCLIKPTTEDQWEFFEQRLEEKYKEAKKILSLRKEIRNKAKGDFNITIRVIKFYGIYKDIKKGNFKKAIETFSKYFS